MSLRNWVKHLISSSNNPPSLAVRSGKHFRRRALLRRAAVLCAALSAVAAAFAALFGSRWRSVPLPDGLDVNDLGCRPGGREIFLRRLAACRTAHL